VPAGDIPSVRVGQEVSFRVEGFGERDFRGRIDRINPATQTGSRSILVYAVLLNQDGALKGGMFAKGSVTLNRIDSAQVLPLSAVREENGGAHVMRIVNDRLESLPVKLGLRNEDEGTVQIVEGLDVESRVIRANTGAYKPGTLVKIASSRNETARAGK